MKNKFWLWSLLVVIISLIIGIIAYPKLPASVPSHWDAAGNLNGYTSRFWGAFLMPIISLGMFLLLLIVPKLDPRKENIQKFRKYYDGLIFVLMLYLFALYVYTLLWTFGFKFPIMQLMSILFAGLFFYIGILMENAKQNWSIGIRTPWTLESESVWNKTHKLGGRLYKSMVIFALVGLFLPNAAFWLIILPIFTISIYLVIYSYIEYKKENR